MKKKKSHLLSLIRNSVFLILNSSRGFTLLESIVAIAIFTIGVSTAMTVISTSLNVGTRTRDKIIASYLAQEGIEVVRSIRDNNWLSSQPWTDGILPDTANGCVQHNSASVDTMCSMGFSLTFNPSSSPPAYLSNAGAATFSRTISVQTISADQIHIISAVNCGLNCNVSVEEDLYDWK